MHLKQQLLCALWVVMLQWLVTWPGKWGVQGSHIDVMGWYRLIQLRALFVPDVVLCIGWRGSRAHKQAAALLLTVYWLIE